MGHEMGQMGFVTLQLPWMIKLIVIPYNVTVTNGPRLDVNECMKKTPNFYRPPTKLRESYVFSCVCLALRSQGEVPHDHYP